MSRTSRESTFGVLNTMQASLKRIWISSFLTLVALASQGFGAPLDDQIEAFKKAPSQDERMVQQILQSGLKENRSAKAFASVQGWLNANPSESQELLFLAGQSAERAGEWKLAVSFYRKLLKKNGLNANYAAQAAPAVYRILINHLEDSESAYLFMREDGGRLRQYGRARQFDSWFLAKAHEREDLGAIAGRLAAIHGNPGEDPSAYQEHTDLLFEKLERFSVIAENAGLIEEMDKLSAAATRSPEIKARWDWILQVLIYSRNAAQLILDRKNEAPAEMFDRPVQAAKALVAVEPYEGTKLVAKGWAQWNHGDTPTFMRFVHLERERKAQPILDAISRLSPGEAKRLLNAQFQGPRGRTLTVATYLSPATVRGLAPKMPEVFNALDAPGAEFWDKEISVEEAKAVAPHITRNPHPSAALVRAYAASGQKTVAGLVPALMKSERWRFPDSKSAIDLIWNSGVDREEANAAELVKQYEKPGARYDELKKQVAKNANSQNRMAAFNSLRGELLGGNLSTPGLIPLWDELFTNSPDEDKVKMLIALSGDLRGDREYLLRRASGKSSFGKSGKLFWQAYVYDNHFRYHQGDTRENGGDLIAHLQKLVETQAQAGLLNETIFGLWVHSVERKDQAAQDLMAKLLESQAFAKLDSSYQNAALDRNHFGEFAASWKEDVTSAEYLSQELLDLPEDAQTPAIEAAFNAVLDRIKGASLPVAPIGLQKVAALENWSPPIRSQVLSLFRENAPLGAYPAKQGYEALVKRLAEEAVEKNSRGELEPYAAGLWHAAVSTDDGRRYPGANALALLAESGLENGFASIAATFSRAATRGPMGRAVLSREEFDIPKIASILRGVGGESALAIGAVEIPVDETDPAFPFYKSNAEFVLGNLESSWSLYDKNAESLTGEILQKLAVEYAFFLLEQNTVLDETDRAESLVKELTIWSRQVAGSFTPEQEARLKIAYADLAFLKGALPTSRAWYRKVADAAEYKGSEIELTATLGSVKVDRVSKNFGAAMTELDKLLRLKNPEFRKRVHYARAEVFMDQENYKEALDEVTSVLRKEPKHPDALILRGKIQNEMRKLVEASEIALGPSQDDTVIVPGETVKINLRDPTLSVSGVGADIEVEVWAKSGDRERVMLYQLGDSKENFRAEVPTTLGPPVPNDKTLQILGEDEIRFGYSKRFREKMDDLPPDPDLAITVASDAQLDITAGAFPARKGERKLNIEELGLSTAQAALGTRAVRPGNPVYLRVTDSDASKTANVDELLISLQASSGDEIRKLVLKETGPFTGEFQAIVPTTGAQALAFASESAPGRDPNMAISSQPYPGWQGKVGDKDEVRIFGVDLNDNVELDRLDVTMGAGQELSHFVLQTSLNGRDWTTRARYPEHQAPWDGKPRVTSFPTYRGGFPVSEPEGRALPEDWKEKMELGSASAACGYLAAHVTNLTGGKDFPMVNTGHPGYSGLFRFRALFYQPNAAVRTFRLTGLPHVDDKRVVKTIFLINGAPSSEESDDAFTIEREFAPGLHEIEVWHHGGRDAILKSTPQLLCDEAGKAELIPCPDSMFDPSSFPEGVQAQIARAATIEEAENRTLNVVFGDETRARLARFVILGFNGVAPAVEKVTLLDRSGEQLLPVEQDFMALRQNTQLEVLPGDTITARYLDEVSATPKRNRHEGRLTVAFNTAEISASFLNYETTEEGRKLLLEPIRRFQFDDAVAIVIDDADMDGSPQKDVVEFQVKTSEGKTATMKAVETEEHSGQFIGRVFPVEGEPTRSSEIQLSEGGSITAIYRDMENLEPGIPADRSVTISHAQYETPELGFYTMSAKTLPPPPPAEKSPEEEAKAKRVTGPEVFHPRGELVYTYADEESAAASNPKGVLGADLRFDVIAPHFALARSSEITAFVQTESARKAVENMEGAFDLNVPGTLKLAGTLSGNTVEPPLGYVVGTPPVAPGNEPALEVGRFGFRIPLLLGDVPNRSYANESAEALPASAFPDGLAVRPGDTVYVGFSWEDEAGEIQWKTAQFELGSQAFLAVMENGYTENLVSAFVGEKVYLRLLAPGLDRGPERDVAEVVLEATSGVSTTYRLQETEGHSGIFKSSFTISYDDEFEEGQTSGRKLPPVELNGFPVRYGDDITVRFDGESHVISVNKGADGFVQPFSKRFTGDEMAVRTGFTLAECFFELAKKHREMEQESLARREIGHARKLLEEALATHRDDEMKAHAEYLLGNLAQEFADLAKNDESKLPMYQDALARFSKIPTDYPETDFAPKAQYKTALVYQKMGEVENSVEEYVKLAYKYPDHELIPSVMSQLGTYFQAKGQKYKDQADPLRKKEDQESIAEVLRLDELSFPEFLNAAMVFSKLQSRFPDDPLAGLSGVRAGQNFMRAHQYQEAIEAFQVVIDNEEYDGGSIRARALFWSGYSRELYPASESDYRTRGRMIREAYEIYRRITFDFPDSIWAKRARGRLADPTFERIIELENKERERMLEALKEARK